MAMISEEDQSFLRDHFKQELRNPVKLVFFTQHDTEGTVPGQVCMYCRETASLLEEVAALSDLVEMETFDFVKDAERAKDFGVEMIPATVILGPPSGGLKYYGIPSGYEFSTLIEDIVAVSRGDSGLSEETRRQLANITKDTHVQVFTTPT